MKTKTALLFLVASLSIVGCSSVEVLNNSGTDLAAKAITPYFEKGELPGAINVFYNNGVQEVACVGYADVEKKRPIALDNAYMQCSQTKGFCGVTIAILVEEGKLNLDDPVSKYLPEFGELWVKASTSKDARRLVKAKNVLTVRQVMNHTGGFAFELPFHTKIGGWSRRMPLRSVAAMAAALPLEFEPGTKVRYSNVGIDIGAAVVEIITGKRWEDFLKERVLDPLGMRNSTFWPTDAQLANKIEMYDVKGGKVAKWRKEHPAMARPYNDDRVFSSAGAGLWTTVEDQLKFYKMLMNLGMGENGVRILKEQTVKDILAKSTRPTGLGGYSLGLTAPEVDGEDQWFGHGGAWGTNCSVNWHKRQLKLWAVQFCGGPRPWDKDRAKAADEFFKVKIDNSGVDAYTGRMK